ncbi:hypothetical protein FZC74_18425 [Sutcliffiella horikoshii]|uniref:Uncharacterized protein n=1 Tax=Sutcliffiella horikoshii TaxID=79883 RepID=A0AA95B4K9_9BACI|nr:hypothetical protein FZC74_18425 [Sutcliffiella horikoshii]
MDWSKWRRLLREIALGGDPAGEAEEAPAAPLGKRSHLRKGTAAIYQLTIVLKRTEHLLHGFFSFQNFSLIALMYVSMLWFLMMEPSVSRKREGVMVCL